VDVCLCQPWLSLIPLCLAVVRDLMCAMAAVCVLLGTRLRSSWPAQSRPGTYLNWLFLCDPSCLVSQIAPLIPTPRLHFLMTGFTPLTLESKVPLRVSLACLLASTRGLRLLC
jgi:hypothetical protein